MFFVFMVMIAETARTASPGPTEAAGARTSFFVNHDYYTNFEKTFSDFITSIICFTSD